MRRTRSTAHMVAILVALSLPQVLLAACDQTPTAKGNSTPTTVTPGTASGTPAPKPPFVFVASQDGNLYALDGHTGVLAWKIAAAGCTAPRIGYADGTVYLTTCTTTLGAHPTQSTCHVQALRAQDHALLWDTAIDGTFIDCAITVGSGNVYASVAPCSNVQDVSTAPSGLYALRASDGKRLWRAVVTNAQSLARGGCPYYSSPAVDQDIAYFSAGDGLYATRVSDGSVTQLASLQHGSFTTPFLAGGTLYASGSWSSSATIEVDHSALFAFSTAGAQLWKHDMPSSSSAPVVVDGLLYASADGVYALNASDGTLRWRFGLTTPGGPSLLSPVTPAVAGGIVYAGGSGGLEALHATSAGGLLWVQGPPALSTPTPVVGDGIVYFGGDDNKLYALTATTGAVRWSYPTGGQLQAITLGQ